MAFIKGNVPWNKGMKMSEKYSHCGFQKGNKLAYLRKTIGTLFTKGHKDFRINKTPWNKNRKCPELSGENHPMYGKHHTKETIRKIKEARKRQGKMNSGEKHWNWKGGINPINNSIRKSFEYKQWRETVFKKDNYTCWICGQFSGKLVAHHLKAFSLYPELRFETNNGITLCRICHFLYTETRPKF